MKRKHIWIGVIVAAGLGGGGWAAAHRGPKPTPVELATVGREDLQAKVTANGKVQAQKKVDISATIAGQVTHLAVREGDRVTKGQFLLQIDPVNPRAAARSTEFSMQALLRDLDSAQASLEQARSDYKRAQANFEARIIPEADLQRSRTTVSTAEASVSAIQRRVDEARARLEGAQDTLSKTTVRAPMDGIVTAKRVEEGEVAVIGIQNSPGTVLLTVSDMSIVETQLEVDETSIPNVKVGQDARIRVDAYPNQTFDGVVTEVGSSPLLPAGGGSTNDAIKFQVKVQIKNPPADIKPGLSVQADILTGSRDKALVVPIQALVMRDKPAGPGAPKAAAGTPKEEEGVYVVDGGKVRFQTIKTGMLGEMSLEVVSGLKGGEQIVNGPFRALRSLKDGDLVKPEDKKKPEGGGDKG